MSGFLRLCMACPTMAADLVRRAPCVLRSGRARRLGGTERSALLRAGQLAPPTSSALRRDVNHYEPSCRERQRHSHESSGRSRASWPRATESRSLGGRTKLRYRGGRCPPSNKISVELREGATHCVCSTSTLPRRIQEVNAHIQEVNAHRKACKLAHRTVRVGAALDQERQQPQLQYLTVEVV